MNKSAQERASTLTDDTLQVVVGLAVMAIIALFVWVATRNEPSDKGTPGLLAQRSIARLNELGGQLGLSTAMLRCTAFAKDGHRTATCAMLQPNGDALATQLRALGWNDGGRTSSILAGRELGWRRQFERGNERLTFACEGADPVRCYVSLRTPWL